MTKRRAVPPEGVKELASSADLTLDPNNANRGTERGAELLKESLDACGVGRSILVDKRGVVISGNKTLAAARAAGIEIEVVQTNGQDLVVVQRTDLDLVEDPKARQLAYYDNRVQELDLSWDVGVIEEDLLSGVNVGCAFFPEEIDALKHANLAPASAELPADVAPVEHVDVPAASALRTTAAPRVTYVLAFDTLEQQLRWAAFSRFLRQRFRDRSTPGSRLAAFLSEVGVQ